ncbi:signal peptidase I [Coraliomargarita parva]|uniref:signal peptidase I n=1 Tax=Coraliomargarita parva TaxID=3014050 RepID=UPI0022B52546|nr:signal peptidase I [Coraliomargarita parva]
MRKLLKQAREVLHGAHKVYHYRRDVISESRLKELDKAVEELSGLVKRRDSGEAARLEASIGRLDALLRKIGGKIYPKTFWSDNLEVALVASIIVIGIRTFFFQPFIIPTNSMYPTYSGMNAMVYEADEGEPSFAAKLFNLARLGARHRALVAERSGDILIPVVSNSNGTGIRIYQETVKVPRGKWLILPALMNEYRFIIGGKVQSIRVPAEFDMNQVIFGVFDRSSMELVETKGEGTGMALLVKNKRAVAGEDVLRFDITLGDALFVDRFTYHFRKPKAGEPFVFKTRNIPGIDGNPNHYSDKYYIKRIGGAPGETIEIRDHGLFVNGQARDEAKAFARNADQEGEYDGYINVEPYNYVRHKFSGLEAGSELTIPEGKYVALGDNSDNSLDSRYWGYVPEKEIIGKALFIYYPFTKRWGLAE